MIGSLFFLALTSFVGVSCAVPFMDQAESKTNGDVVYTSHVDGLDYQMFYQGHQTLVALTNPYHSVPIRINFNNNITSSIAGGSYYDFIDYDGGLFDQYAEGLSNSYSDANMFLVYAQQQNQSNVYALKFFVPYNYKVKHIEIHTSFDATLGFYSLTKNYSSQYDGNDFFIMLSSESSSSYFAMDDQTLTTSYKFTEFVIYATLTDFTNAFIDYCILGDAVQNDYAIGYTAGYNQGHTDGYAEGLEYGETTGHQNGYTTGYNTGLSDGLNMAQTSNFNSLFNAIADTPVVFMRSLFGFELFGMNVFAIIMSLITGLIVIYVIKKVWK